MTNYTALANLAAGLSQAAGGIAANASAKNQANIAQREAEERARLNDQDVKAFIANQEVSFLKAGVELEGSPLIVLKDTINKGYAQSESIRNAGGRRSTALRETGRNALLSGALSGALSISQIATKAKENQIKSGETE